MRVAYDLILHLGDSEAKMIKLAGHAGGLHPPATQCPDTRDLTEMASNAILRSDCTYVSSLSVSAPAGCSFNDSSVILQLQYLYTV